MSKAIKKYFVLTICLLFLLALFNCGNSQNDADIKTDIDTGSTEKYIIQFETNTDAKVHAKKQSKGTKVILPTDIEKKGYIFDGWYCNGEKWIEESRVTENLTLEAKWTPIEYKITYIDGEGTVKTYTVEDEIELPCVKEDDYYFVGWTKEINGTEFYNKIKKGTTGNITLYASKIYFGCIFTEKADGTYEISGYHKLNTEKLEYIILPSEYKGKPVTSIGESAFEYLNVATLEIPSSIKKIGIRSFANTSATKLIVNEGVEEIERSAFSGSNLQEVQLADSITVLNEYAFSSCRDLKTINIPKNLTFLGLGAFGGCAELSIDVVIPEGVTEIWDDAFRKCEKIKSVKFHNKITYIGSNSFQECFAIKEIEIYSGSIDLCAFYYCVGLEKVMIHKEVESINSVAFDFVDAPIYTDATEKPENWHIDVVLNYTPSEES